jgi:PAS domain S-box-containing protein
MFRRFLWYFVPLSIGLAAVLWAVYWAESSARMADLRRAEEKYVALAAEALAHDFHAAITDLLLLADSGSLRRALETGLKEDFTAAAAEFQNVAEKKRVYDQIRYIDPEGKEILRINFDGAEAWIVPDEDLQSKVDRYYFHETIDLAPETVFVSPFDLNVEDGRIEVPHKPTVRFGTPVFDSGSRRRGIVVLNYLGATMLRRFARLDVDSPGQAMLLNAEGYWLYAGDPKVEWAFMFPENSGQRFAERYPASWRLIAPQDTGQVYTQEGLLTFAVVRPLRGADTAGGPARPENLTAASPEYAWRIVSLVRPTDVAAHLSGVRWNTLALAGLLLAVTGGGSWILARYSTARERSEVRLRASEARFRQMADSIAEVFWLSTSDRRQLQYLSPAFTEIWGRTYDSLDEAARLWEASILASDRRKHQITLEKLPGIDEFSAEYRIRRADGSVRWIWDHGFAVRAADGSISGYAGIAEDVTPLKEAQEKALQSGRLAAIGEAMAGLAHESRNALQRSQACLEMLQKRVSGQPEAIGLLERMQTAVRDLHHLHERVRCYAAPIQLRREPCDLKQVWERACENAAACAAERRLEIENGAPTRSSAQSARQIECFADEVAIGQVFRNILENALDPELKSASGNAVRIRIDWDETVWREQPAVKVTISDNGPGLQEAVQNRIFEPFFTTKSRGTGLGLAICRRIVEAHGGTITASNGAGRGLTLEIILPKGPDAVTDVAGFGQSHVAEAASFG